MTDVLTRPEATLPRGDASDQTHSQPSRRPRRTPRLPAATLTRIAHGLLWTLVVVGAVSGPAALLRQAVAAPQPAPAVELPEPTVGVEGFAEVFVATFLGEAGRGTEEVLRPFYPVPVELREVTPGGVYVVRTATVAAEEQGSGYWAVTVAADVLTAVDGEYRPGGWRYYTVGVAERDGRWVATGLPAQVPAPATGEDHPRLAVANLAAPRDEPQVATVERFLAALLAGEGDLDRYVAPGAQLRPIHPAPYTETRLARLGLAEQPDGGVLARVEVVAADPAGVAHRLHYSLALVERDGRWEVAAVHPAPPLSPTP